jgi:hypothetical protein
MIFTILVFKNLFKINFNLLYNYMNDIKWDNIEKLIMESKYPFQLLLLLFLKKELFKDDDMVLVIRFFFKYHYKIFIENNIKQLLLLLDNYNQSINLINDFYENISNQISLLYNLKKFKNAYNRYFFWKKNINEQIEYLDNLHTKFLGINDCSIGNLYFHNKLKIISKDRNNINANEIFNRLNITYKMFGKKFFDTYNINLLSYEDFYNISLSGKIRFTEYIFVKVNNILLTIIEQFKLYQCIICYINNITNPKYINIESDIFTSEIEDIDF